MLPCFISCRPVNGLLDECRLLCIKIFPLLIIACRDQQTFVILSVTCCMCSLNVVVSPVFMSWYILADQPYRRQYDNMMESSAIDVTLHQAPGDSYPVLMNQLWASILLM